MYQSSIVAMIPITLSLILTGAPAVATQDTPAGATGDAAIYTPGEVQWREGPPTLPRGARMAVLEGDPAREGHYFAFRLALPDGYTIPPHWHPVPERVTVISGTFRLGMGETFDEGQLRSLPAGSFFTMPAGMRHFARAEGETVIQLNSIGPFQIHYVNPADDPRRSSE